jgi:hypothetical protein
MVYRKGELTPRRILRDWPHHVLVRVPGEGLGNRFMEMKAFCQGRDHKTAGALGLAQSRGWSDAMWWCFKSETDAEAFRAKFGTATI